MVVPDSLEFSLIQMAIILQRLYTRSVNWKGMCPGADLVPFIAEAITFPIRHHCLDAVARLMRLLRGGRSSHRSTSAHARSERLASLHVHPIGLVTREFVIVGTRLKARRLVAPSGTVSCTGWPRTQRRQHAVIMNRSR